VTVPQWPDRPPPRIEREDFTSPRLDFSVAAPLVPVESPKPPVPGSLAPILGGGAVLAVGLGAVSAAGFVADQFQRGPVAGGIAAGIAVIGFGLVGLGLWRELRGLLTLREVDETRAALASSDPAIVRRAATIWLRRLPGHHSVLPALAALDDAAAMRALLRAGPLAALRDESDTHARIAALQMAAIIAVTPSAAFDALAVGWRGLRLMREIAALHGLRPGLLATLALLRRTALSALGVAATELAVNSAAHALLSNPLLGHVLGDMAGAGIAARRMLVLARATALACAPLSPEE
jgi:putative membrane protein